MGGLDYDSKTNFRFSGEQTGDYGGADRGIVPKSGGYAGAFLAETSDFGIARIITDDVYNAMQMLKEAGYVCSITKVLAVEIPDRPGELAKVIRYLGDSGINVEYMYAFITRKKDLAYMIFRVEDNEKAIQVLTKKNVNLICQDALDQL